MSYLIAYLAAGLLVSFAHPQLRKILFQSIKEKGDGPLANAAIVSALILFMVLLWPFVLVFRRRNLAEEEARLNEVKRHLGVRGRKITESDGVLMTYRRVIEKQFLDAAKERGEHLSEESLREIAFHYLDAWVAANENRLGIAMPFLISGGVDTYRKEGLKALLAEIRKDEFAS